MKLDEIYILYKNTGKYFKSYTEAYFNSKKPMQEKQVYYVFTPTMQEYKRVGELERGARNYFNRVLDCDFYDIVNRQAFKQLNLIGEL